VKSIAGVLLAVGMLALFGCGGSSSGDSSLTKAEFIKEMNQQCKQEVEVRSKAEKDKQKELGLEPGEFANASQQKKIVEASVPPYEKVTEQIEELAPSDQADEIEPLIKAREEVVEVVLDARPSDQSLAALKKANDLAIKNDLDSCSI
jgi:hypothetical protein